MVKDVTPALQTNSEGLKKVLEELVKQYKRQQEEMERWKASLPRWMLQTLLTSFPCFRKRTTSRLSSSRCQAFVRNLDSLSFHGLLVESTWFLHM